MLENSNMNDKEHLTIEKDKGKAVYNWMIIIFIVIGSAFVVEGYFPSRTFKCYEMDELDGEAQASSTIKISANFVQNGAFTIKIDGKVAQVQYLPNLLSEGRHFYAGTLKDKEACQSENRWFFVLTERPMIDFFRSGVHRDGAKNVITFMSQHDPVSRMSEKMYMIR